MRCTLAGESLHRPPQPRSLQIAGASGECSGCRATWPHHECTARLNLSQATSQALTPCNVASPTGTSATKVQAATQDSNNYLPRKLRNKDSPHHKKGLGAMGALASESATSGGVADERATVRRVLHCVCCSATGSERLSSQTKHKMDKRNVRARNAPAALVNFQVGCPCAEAGGDGQASAPRASTGKHAAVGRAVDNSRLGGASCASDPHRNAITQHSMTPHQPLHAPGQALQKCGPC